MKKILLIVPISTLNWGTKNTGGVDSVCQILVEELTKKLSKDFFYRVLGFDPTNSTIFRNEPITLSDNVEAVFCPLKEKVYGLNCSSLLSSNIRVKQQVESFKPDIVHVHQAIWLLGAFNVKHKIATLHSYKKIGRKPVSRLNDFIYEDLLPPITNSIATKFSVVGCALKQKLSEDTRKKISVIENPLSNNFFSLKDKMWVFGEKIKIVTCALIKRQKRVHLVIELVAELKHLGKDVELNIIGPDCDSLYFKELTTLVSNLGLSEIVHFAGGCNQSEIINYYRKSDLAVFLSEEETFGLAPLEMLASGLPLISSKVGVLNSRFDDFYKLRNLLIVEEIDIPKIVEKLDCIFNANCTPSVEYIKSNFSASKIVEDYQTMYRELLQ